MSEMTKCEHCGLTLERLASPHVPGEEAMTVPTDADLAELERLMSEGTPGPWTVSVINDVPRDDSIGIIARGADVVTHGGLWPSMQSAEDAALIVAAVNALPDLIAELRRLRAENAELRGGQVATLQRQIDELRADVSGPTVLAWAARARMDLETIVLIGNRGASNIARDCAQAAPPAIFVAAKETK